MTIRLNGAVASKIGFASHQNAVPVLRTLEILNESDEMFEGLQLSITADPPFIQPKSWTVDRVSPEATLHITDRELKLNGAFLGELTESLRGEIRLTLTRQDVSLAEEAFPIELLARAEWGGADTMAELLPAFVMPNDPSVDRMLKAASEVLRRAGKPDGIDGYQSGSRTRVWQLVSAMWSAVAGASISYALPPASFERQGQKVRTPSAVLDGKVATCLDTALLFCAMIEQAGLNPLILLSKDHAFVGVWLQPQEFSDLITDDAGSVRKRFDLDELLVFETTLVTQRPVPRFDQAVAEARRQIGQENEHNFLMAVDVRRARMQRIQPLAVALNRQETEVDVAMSEGLLEAPRLPDFDIDTPEADATVADRLMVWQRKLLDLTTRNRLLHVPDNAKIVRLICPDPAKLEDQLADGKKIKITPMPDLQAGGRDEMLYQQQNAERLSDEYARSALDRGEVLSSLDKAKLDATLIELYRKARSDLEEGGANTLFLALGFLRWRKSADDTKIYRAPLILLPVKLERKSAISGVTLSAHEDEPRFNLTLLELLRHDFELTMSALEEPLPGDESGVDVSKVWTMVRRAVRDLPGFEVVEDLAIGTFSFAKYLMWKDLVDRADQLMDSPIVRHLVERGVERFETGGEFPSAKDLDRKVDPAALFAPLPGDSSQLAAVVASGNGCSFVLDGPPGTGKSQTIANMIAHNLALGRRVLFVAEKRAALDVVYRRLEEKGLGEFCLELHSNKAAKADVLRQLERAWDTRDSLSDEEWRREATEARRLRNALNRLVEVLHTKRPNGLTIHDAMGRVIRDAGPATPRLSWPEGTAHSEDELIALRDLARRLGIARTAIIGAPDVFGHIRKSQWTNGWQEALSAAAADVPARIDALLEAKNALISATRLPLSAESERAMEALRDLSVLLLSAHGRDLRLTFTPDFAAKATAIRRALVVIEEYQAVESGLSIRYASEAARRLDIAQFDESLTKANARFWFLANLARRKLARALAVAGGGTGLPNIEADLSRFRRLKASLEELDSLSSHLASVPGWSSTTSNVAVMRDTLELSERIRSRIASLSGTPEELVQLRRQTETLVVDANELLAADGAIAIAHARLEAELPRCATAIQRLGELAEWSVPEEGVGYDAVRTLAGSILAASPKLKAWCDWHRVREEAVFANLTPLVDALGGIETAQSVSMFETAYARWFAGQAIDAEPLLSELITDVHMDDIQAFRLLEDRLSELAVRYVRAKLCGQIPDKNSISKRDGYGILKHQLQLQRRHKPVRQLATEMGEAFDRLAPCMLMSPLSIAQYLPAGQALFDLVIFDEASQIAPWDAIGSIARGRQVVVAGDPRQMPPTSFFNRAAGATDDDSATDEDMESILDECLAVGIPQHGLEWHYRSRHESLIAFSNHRYYESKLITFPAPETRESAVSWRKAAGIYAKGSTRTNQAEAEAMVAEAIARLQNPAFGGAGKSLAIVTLNSEQQKLVEDLLDQARRRHPRIERFFGEGVIEPVVVKNLETVQGDERDLILLGIGYGPHEPHAETMSMNFGPLNREGGWRRLNVAVTRAREEMIVFTSFGSSMIDLNRTSARAVRDLKHFIEFAERGPRALAEAIQGSVGGYESPFEQAVAEALSRRGWTVVPQIGVSRFRIDLGIVHPDRPGDYLVGVECDGAAYHSAATARDRDKVRAAILERLGWRLIRIWSTDWWVDKEGATDRLHRAIEAALEESRRASLAEEAADQETSPGSIDIEVPGADGLEVEEYVDLANEPAAEAAQVVNGAKHHRAEAISSTYQIARFAVHASSIDPASFYDRTYDGILNTLVRHVLEAEAPICETLLVQRIARAHGFQRSGRLIRERVMAIAKRHHHMAKEPNGSIFIWLDPAQSTEWQYSRTPAGEEDIRQIEEIAFEELRAASSLCWTSDPATEIARLFGIRRLSSSARSRLESALEAGI